MYLNKFAFIFKDKHFMFMTTFYSAPPISTNGKETARILKNSRKKLKKSAFKEAKRKLKP